MGEAETLDLLIALVAGFVLGMFFVFATYALTDD